MIIWIASYPKSGNTLIRSLLYSLLVSPDGGLDLSKDHQAIKKSGGRELGNGAAGHGPSKPYSDSFK